MECKQGTVDCTAPLRHDYDLFGAANTPVRLAAQMNELEIAAQERALGAL